MLQLLKLVLAYAPYNVDNFEKKIDINISFIYKDIKEKLKKIFYGGDKKNVLQFKISDTIFGYLEKDDVTDACVLYPSNQRC